MGINTSPGPVTKRTGKIEFTEQLVGHTLPSHRFRRHPAVTRLLHEAEERKFARVARMRAAGHWTAKVLPFAMIPSRNTFTRADANTLVAQRRNERMAKRWVKQGEVRDE